MSVEDPQHGVDLFLEMQPDAACPSCGVRGSVQRTSRAGTDSIRGLEVRVTKVLRRCGGCGSEFENTRDPDWRPEAYRQYREATGMVTPEAIVAWRVRGGLTRAETAALLGWDEATLGRYERGSLQSAAQDRQLAALAGRPIQA